MKRIIAVHFSDLPDTGEAFRARNQTSIPAGYAFVNEVHLREKPSSRSRDLGMLNSGVIVKITGIEPGNPFPWCQVELGNLKGYVSSKYVCQDDAGQPTASPDAALPVVEAIRDTDIKVGTGWFDRSVMQVHPGTRMHVLFERDGWYYVCIPKEQIDFCMDVEGTYGFIRTDTVEK